MQIYHEDFQSLLTRLSVLLLMKQVKFKEISRTNIKYPLQIAEQGRPFHWYQRFFQNNQHQSFELNYLRKFYIISYYSYLVREVPHAKLSVTCGDNSPLVGQTDVGTVNVF